jgi:UDP-N-acetylmuramate: L-alanyl-gamma-D-glutamyl-meso-diaminopimelate ligase
MKVHFIAVGGSAMHNLALALHHKGYEISGSDDEIFEPSRSRLEKAGLLPAEYGWFTEKITNDLDAVILGMHAKFDNPELNKASDLGVKIYSYPEFLYEQSKDKMRVVIAGSHGKTTITAMIMHVLQEAGMAFDFMVGAQLEGFDVMVSMSEEAKIMLFEGDEYLTSALDPRPKFHLYRPHVALISGIAWDHINVFPTFDIYKDQFKEFIDLIEPGGRLIYYEGDEYLKGLVNSKKNIAYTSYLIPDIHRKGGMVYLQVEDREYPIHVFGDHNMQNMAGAMQVCKSLGVSNKVFATAISSFKGASKRLQLIDENENTSVYLDFAHAPSKLKATVDAVKGHFEEKKLIACMELHTYSSLNKEFLKEYDGAMDKADQAYVYFNPHTLELKKLPEISVEQVKQAFNRDDLKVYNDATEMLSELLQQDMDNTILLLMSSGNFDGLEPADIAKKILSGKA